MIYDRQWLRRRSIPKFIRMMSRRHPELRNPVTFPRFMAIAKREGVLVMHVPLSRPARILRAGENVCIQINRTLKGEERTQPAMHELCHFWRDDPGVPYYNVEDDPRASDSEDFADIFAWVVTSPARIYLPGLRDEDF